MNIIIVGDTLPDSTNYVHFENYNINEIFDEKIINLFNSSDYSILNLEGPLTDSNIYIKKSGPSLKSTPLSINGIVGLGVQCVCVANNHIMDYGYEGFCQTIFQIESNGIEWVGAGYNQNIIKKYVIKNIDGYKVGIYNVAETEFNIPTCNYPGCNLFDEYQTYEDIRTLKGLCDYIIIIYHGGIEEFRFPTPMLRERFHHLVDCGADFVVAQHSHCVGTEETYKGKKLLYGQGNFRFCYDDNEFTREGLIVQILIEKNSFEVKYHLIENKKGKTLYSKNQSLDEVYKRSGILDNQELYNKEYNSFVLKNTGAYLDFIHSKNVFDKFINFFLPKSLYYKYLERIYRNAYSLTILNTVRDADHREIICSILNNYSSE